MDGYVSLAGSLPGWAGVAPPRRGTAYDWRLVANAARADVLRSLFPTAAAGLLHDVDALESTFAMRFGRGQGAGDQGRSIRRGREVAAAVLAWSATDGGHEGYARNFPPYAPPPGLGLWVPTPPALSSALQPFWGGNRCLVLHDGAHCPPTGHPPYSEEPGSLFDDEAIEVYEAAAARTPEQEAIARFWSDDPGQTATPRGHSVAIATQVLRLEGASLARRPRRTRSWAWPCATHSSPAGTRSTPTTCSVR